MLPYDGVPEEATELAAGADKPTPSSWSTRSNAARATTSAWQWDAQWGLYFNCETQQWAKPLPDGSWEYADAVPVPVPVRTTDSDDSNGKPPRRTKKKPRRIDRDDPEQEDEKFDPFAVPEEQIWPGADDDDDADERTTDPYANAPLLRLVVVDPRPDPTVLAPAHKVASIDPGEPVSIGRDKSYERRIRLRELAVSKSHATLFWTVVDPDPDHEIQEPSEGGGGGGGGGYWAIVDNASTHGTFVRAEGEKRFVRLSEAKVASVPHRLYHLDSIRIGSTTFSVHIHPSFACSVCSVASDSSNLIPLVAADTSKDKNDSSVFLTKTKEQKEQDRREQMAGLKAQFLKPNANVSGGKGGGTTARGGNAPVVAQAKDSTALESSATATPPAAKATFVDRAAARRKRDAGASVPLPSNRKPKIPGNSSAASAAISPFFTVPGATASATAAVSTSTAAPPRQPPVDPFAADSRGAQLLSKLAGGVHPADDDRGTNAGSRSSSGQLGTLIEARTTLAGPGERRAGLGSKELVVGVENVAAAASSRNGQGPQGRTNGDWRDAGRERSWKRFREV